MLNQVKEINLRQIMEYGIQCTAMAGTMQLAVTMNIPKDMLMD
jgi:hypothetical protein